MDIRQRSGPDPLDQPTRARLFAVLAQERRALTTDELAGRLERHPNGVRAHLERLAEAGLVVRRRVRHGRGRPRDEWTVAAAARPGGDPPHAYADLGRWLARAIPASAAELRAVAETGREIGRDMTPSGPGEDAAAAFGDALAALGFEPELQSTEAGVCATLGNCPYRDAVKANPALVCTLHRGIAQGVLDAVAPGARITRFLPRDPDEAGCIVEASGLELGAA